MERDPYPIRRSPRLFGFDYRQRGAYFVTICTAGRRELFGTIYNDRLRPSQLGLIASDELPRVSELRRSVSLDTSIIMPNHVHAIIVLRTDGGVRLGSVVNQFKAAVTRRARQIAANAEIWQRGYYERMIRDERELDMTREYIVDNPARWAEDRENIRGV